MLWEYSWERNRTKKARLSLSIDLKGRRNGKEWFQGILSVLVLTLRGERECQSVAFQGLGKLKAVGY